jgi:hypothetical protein
MGNGDGQDGQQSHGDFQLPPDYYGVEGTFDSSGHFQSGTIHNPYHDIPIPGSLDPSQLLPHQGQPQGTSMLPLSHTQIEHLYQARQQLTEAISLLQYSGTAADILQNLPTVLTIANAVVHADASWESELATACHTWIGTQADAGTEEQFQHARDQVIQAAWVVAGDVDQWITQNDQIMFSAQGSMALQQLAQTATSAHQQLQPAPSP